MSIQNIRKSVLVSVAAASILAGGVWAGRMAAGPLGGGRHASAERMFNRLADRLDLSDSQRDQVRAVLRGHKDSILAQVQALRAAHQDLRQAVSASSFDENAIRGKAALLGSVEADAAVLRAQIRAEILPILNDDQKQKLETMHDGTHVRGDRFSASLNEFLSAPDSKQ
jgi:Spy/CpxP family protein refolding chaperone